MSYFAWKTFVPQSWKSLSTLHVLLPEPLTLLSYVYRGSAPKVSSAKKKRKHKVSLESLEMTSGVAAGQRQLRH